MNNCISISCSIIKHTAYFEYLSIMLYSIKEHNGIDIPIILWLESFNDKQKETLKKIYSNIIINDVNREKYKSVNKDTSGWYCLEAFSIKEYDYVLSLDCDFICIKSLDAIWDYDLDNIGMIKERSGLFNGGFLLLNQLYRTPAIYKMLMESKQDEIFLDNNRDNYSKDQKLYNYYFKDNIIELPGIFNYMNDKKYIPEAVMIHYIYKMLHAAGYERIINIDKKYVNIYNQYKNKIKKYL